MQVHLDQHDYFVASVMKDKLLDGYFDFLDDLLYSCKMSEELAELPLKINNDPRFDSTRLPNWLEFFVPGIWILIVFFLGHVMSGDFFIEEVLVCILK